MTDDGDGVGSETSSQDRRSRAFSRGTVRRLAEREVTGWGRRRQTRGWQEETLNNKL